MEYRSSGRSFQVEVAENAGHLLTDLALEILDRGTQCLQVRHETRAPARPVDGPAETLSCSSCIDVGEYRRETVKTSRLEGATYSHPQDCIHSPSPLARSEYNEDRRGGKDASIVIQT
jgi:hypothetical protein